jgi:hypothetical protein
MRPTDAAWAAGFIDGEGHLGIHRIRDRRAAGQRGLRLNPRIVVGQTKRQPLDKLASLFGGSVRQRGEQGPRRRPFFAWELNGATGVLAALRIVRPFLVVKDAEADALALFCERITGWTTGLRLTADEVEARNQLSYALAAVQSTARGAVATTEEP